MEDVKPDAIYLFQVDSNIPLLASSGEGLLFELPELRDPRAFI
jgi:hypothetical protein